MPPLIRQRVVGMQALRSVELRGPWSLSGGICMGVQIKEMMGRDG